MPSGLDIFVFWGQSNMWGASAEASEAPSYSYSNQMWNYKLDGTWENPATDPICDAASTTYPVLPVGGKLNMCKSFADRWIRYNPTRSVGIIVNAAAGKLMSEFARSTNTATMYGAAKARIDAALNSGASGTLRGHIMYQGESNCDTTTNRDAWASGATQWTTDVRSDWGNVPIVFTKIVQLAGDKAVDFPYSPDLQVIQSRLRIGRVAIAQLDDGVLYDGRLHIDAATHTHAGKRTCDAMRILGA